MTSDSDALTADLIAIADAVSIVSPAEYSIRGTKRSFPESPGAPQEKYPEDSPLAASLESDLYAKFYCKPSTASTIPGDPLAHRDHVAALSEANSGTGAWERGWRIVEVRSHNQIAVRKDRVVFWVDRNGLRTNARHLSPGTFCRVLVSKEMRNLSPGFYFAIGNGDPVAKNDKEDALLRLYWHLKAGAAVPYMAQVTTCLNANKIAFRTKVLNDPRSYNRADAGVLYIEQRAAQRLAPHLPSLYSAIRWGLREDVPMFTKKLAPGLGLAEDPGTTQSFGQSRSALVARGLWLAFLAGVRGEKQVEYLVRSFKESGVNPSTPYMSSGSKDGYHSLTIRTVEAHG